MIVSTTSSFSATIIARLLKAGYRISELDIKKAISSAKKAGDITAKIGKYGTLQYHYKGSNGVTVIIESSGRNANKVITTYRHR